MKKSFFLLLGIVSFSLTSFSSISRLDVKSSVAAGTSCCSSYVTYQGETFAAVTVCGGSTLADYVANCVKAEIIRDQMLGIE